MKVQEYPKALYRDREHLQVDNKEQEDDARSDGWKDWQDDQYPTVMSENEVDEQANGKRLRLKAK